MDAFTAIGLAGNIVQFVQFTSDLIKAAVEIHRSSTGCTTDILTLDSLYRQLSDFNDKLNSGHNNAIRYLNGLGSNSIHDLPSLREVSRLCKSDCEDLLSVVDALKKKNQTGKRWQSFRTALKMVWEKRKIEELEKRLTRTQMTMTLQVCTIASHAQEAQAHQLKQLQTESHKLQCNQSAKLDQITAALSCLQERVEQLRPQNQADTALLKELESLEQQLSKLSLSQDAVAEEQALLRSLSFRTRPVRHASIPEAYQKTFRWVYDSENNAPTSATLVAEWLRNGDGVFWVSGKPGSGKSTFMKYIADEPKSLELLSKWSGSQNIVSASHYFWSAGTAMQKSQEGLLRTLLYEIFRQCPELTTVCGNRRPGPGEESENGLLRWSFSDLYETVRKVATRETAFTRFCFFIDGLDEYDGDHGDLCNVLGDLAKSANIKICLSSRPWNIFEQAFGDDHRSKLYMQDLTRNDILKYIRWCLYEHPRWASLATKAFQGDWLVEEIEKRASGVFLWVFLVVRELRKGLTNRDSFSDVCRRLESIPVELELFFRQILESVEPFYHTKMSTTLQMAIAAEEPLHAMAYDFHDQDYDDENYVFKLPAAPYSEEEEGILTEQMVWRLDSRSRGLLEMSRESGTITFLHRSVRDFLKTQEMSDFLADKMPSEFNLPLFLLKVYTAMIKRDLFPEEVRRIYFGVYENSYLQWLTAKALACARKIDDLHPSSTVAYKILEELDRIIPVKVLQNEAKFQYGLEAEVLVREQIIVGQHTGFLAWKLPSDKNYFLTLGASLIPNILSKEFAEEFDEQIPWRSRGVEISRLVLETQILDRNLVWWPWSILIQHATSWSREAPTVVEERFWSLLENNVLSLLLRNGADPDYPIGRNGMECWLAFAGYLNLAFEIPSIKAREALYIQVLRDFLYFGATLDPSEPSLWNDSESGKISTYHLFFGRLETMHTAERQPCNIRLLVDVTDILLSSTKNFKPACLAEAREVARKAVEAAFSAEICERFRIRYPEIPWTQDQGRGPGKRRADTEVESGPAKFLRTSSPSSNRRL